MKKDPSSDSSTFYYKWINI